MKKLKETCWNPETKTQLIKWKDSVISERRRLVQILLNSRKHYLLSEIELEKRNKLFFDHYSRTKYEVCPKWLAHKTEDEFVIIGIPFKHPEKELWRSILIPNKFAKWSLYEDPEMPIVEWVHLIEAINQLGSYIIEEKKVLFKVAKFVWLENWSLTKSLMKSEKHWSVEIYWIENMKLPWWTTIWKYRITIYKWKEIIWGWIFLFSIEDYKEDMVKWDLNSWIEYKINRAKAFLNSKNWD